MAVTVVVVLRFSVVADVMFVHWAGPVAASPVRSRTPKHFTSSTRHTCMHVKVLNKDKIKRTSGGEELAGISNREGKPSVTYAAGKPFSDIFPFWK